MAAYVQSGSQSHAEAVAARIEAGMVYLNGASEDSETLWRLQNVGQRARVGPFGEFLETKAVIRAA